jgi:hypothetical protein
VHDLAIGVVAALLVSWLALVAVLFVMRPSGSVLKDPYGCCRT